MECAIFFPLLASVVHFNYQIHCGWAYPCAVWMGAINITIHNHNELKWALEIYECRCIAVRLRKKNRCRCNMSVNLIFLLLILATFLTIASSFITRISHTFLLTVKLGGISFAWVLQHKWNVYEIYEFSHFLVIFVLAKYFTRSTCVPFVWLSSLALRLKGFHGPA